MLAFLRAQSRTGSRHLLITDVARFYHSVYTHSIPWALHGKSMAKRNRGSNLVGNVLDQLIRSSQDGQTIGLPVGPDTSLLIAELLLAAVDRALAKRLRGVKGVRYIDDYELCFPSLSAAESAVSELQNVLTEYELALNPAKTRIVELPQPLDPIWATDLASSRIRSGRVAQANDLVTFFSKAFALAQEGRDTALNFAIARLRSVTVDRANWPLLQDLLLQCVTSELGTFRFVIDELRRHEQAGLPLARQTLGDVTNDHLQRSTTLGYASEVAWGLWCAVTFQLPLERRVAAVISKMSDSIVALVALDARGRGLIARGLDTGLWETFMTADGLSGEHWLLSYEANVKGWLPTRGSGDHVEQDSAFGYLKRLGVSFYDPQRTVPGIPASAGPEPGSAPYDGLP